MTDSPSPPDPRDDPTSAPLLDRCTRQPERRVLVGPDGRRIRTAFADALRGAEGLDLALSRIRLDTLGSVPSLLAGVRRTRLLLGEVRADVIDAEAHALAVRPVGRARLRELVRLLQEDRVRVRAAPLGRWHPDFSLFEHPDGRSSGLVGSHAFGGGGPGSGPLVAIRLEGEEALGPLPAEFERIWSRAHDVSAALEVMLRRAIRWSAVPRPADLADPESAA